MKTERKLNLLIVATILSSLIGYLEWGGGNSAFMFEGEAEVIRQFISNPVNAIHPFTVLPLLGQLLLLLVLVWKKYEKWLLYFGILGIGTLYSFILLIGVLSLNWKVFISIIPFFFFAIWTLRFYRKKVTS